MTTSGTGPVTAEAWVATALGDPTKVLERQQVEVPAPQANEVRIAVDGRALDRTAGGSVRGASDGTSTG